MRGIAVGAVTGVAVGAAALAGLSVLAPPDAGPAGTVAAVLTEEDQGSDSLPGTTVVIASEGPDASPAAPEAVAPEPEPATADPELATVAPSAASPEPMFEDSLAPEPLPEIPETPASEPVPEVAPAPAPEAEPDIGTGAETPRAEVAEAVESTPPAVVPPAVVTPTETQPPEVGQAEVQVPAAPASSTAPEPPLAETPIPAAPPAPDSLAPPEAVAAREALPEPPTPAPAPIATVEAPPPASAPEEPEPVLAVPQEAGPGVPALGATLPAAPSPGSLPAEPGLAQAQEPAPPPQEAPSPAEAPSAVASSEVEPTTPDELPEGPAATPKAEPALPGRVTVGGQSLPGGGPVRVNRPGVEAEPAPEPAAEEAPPEAPAGDLPAVKRFAAAWEPPAEARPLLSLVLIDDGATDPAALAALPWPVSVALDPAGEGAAERLAAYRAVGIEALVLAELPAAAQPVDVEVFLGSALDALPETVAVLDLGRGGLGGRDATAQMAMSQVARDGRGLVLGDQGFRSGLDLAGREGVPAAEVLRDLDGEGQDGPAIRRGLDDAVRRAGQEGQAVLVGRMRPETLAALSEWSQDGRAQEVTVAPVSAVLGGATPQE